MPCNRHPLLPLCSISTLVSRDGYSGANASIYIPFMGQYFFDGSTRSYPGSTVPQDNSRTIGGSRRKGTFSKGYTCECEGGCASC